MQLNSDSYGDGFRDFLEQEIGPVAAVAETANELELVDPDIRAVFEGKMTMVGVATQAQLAKDIRRLSAARVGPLIRLNDNEVINADQIVRAKRNGRHVTLFGKALGGDWGSGTEIRSIFDVDGSLWNAILATSNIQTPNRAEGTKN